jgi:hypothetical protein
MLRSKAIKYLFCTDFHVQFYYVSKPRYDLKRLNQHWERFHMMHKAPHNVYQHEIAKVGISFCCLGVRPIALFVRCSTLYFGKTKYKNYKFHPDNGVILKTQITFLN